MSAAALLVLNIQYFHFVLSCMESGLSDTSFLCFGRQCTL